MITGGVTLYVNNLFDDDTPFGITSGEDFTINDDPATNTSPVGQQFPLRSYSFDFIGFSVRTAGLPIEGTRKPLRPLLEG